MIDIEQQLAYWRSSADEDFAVGRDLITTGRVRHGLFFIHLALEKLLKAHVCKGTRNLAPRIHNLVRLVEAAQLNPNKEDLNALAEMNAFNIEGRYPSSLGPPPTAEEAGVYLEQADRVFKWLKNLL